jgi:hypothetical protein
MRIDSSGRVGIGVTSPSNLLHLQASDVTMRLEDTDASGYSLISTTGTSDLQFKADDGNNDASTKITFDIDGTERMSIASSGKINHTSIANDDVTINHTITSASPFAVQLDFSNASPDNNSNYFLRCQDSTSNRLYIMSDGDVKNHDNSYGSLSDERIKQDIRDSNSQWNDIKNIKVRNFKKKDDVRQYGENAWEQIGVIAQELETVSPKLIKHSEPSPSDILSDASFGTLYKEGDEIPEGKKVGDVKEIYEQVKSVSYSVIYMKAIKALQEAMERIEQLETKNISLEARLTALES